VHTLTDGDLQTLFQLTSAGFPTGSFSHSYGLETFVQDGRVQDGGTFGEWLDVHLAYSVGPTDGAAVGLVQRAASTGDWDAVVRVDRLLTALKLPPEVQTASLATGQAMLRSARAIFSGEAVGRYATLLGDRQARGNTAAVFGCIAADLTVSTSVAILAFLWSVASGLTAVATRLVPLGATVAQRVLYESQPRIRDAARRAETRREHELAASAIAQDIAALRHPRLYSRLFMS
jgi:urease accessory protein